MKSLAWPNQSLEPTRVGNPPLAAQLQRSVVLTMRKTFVGVVAGVFGLALLCLIRVPHYHADVFYVLIFLSLALLGFIGAILVPGRFLAFCVVAGFWVALYLVNSLRYGFLMRGFIAHLWGVVGLGIVILPTAFIAHSVRPARQAKYGDVRHPTPAFQRPFPGRRG